MALGQKLRAPAAIGGRNSPFPPAVVFLDPVELEVEEGGRRLRTHLERERSGRLVSWFKRRLPHARCEAGPTTLDDLRAVCSNCYRMLHRRFPALRAEDLRGRVAELRALLGARA